MKNELLLVIFKYGASMYEKRDIMHQTLLPWHFLDRGRFSFLFQRDFLQGTDECSIKAREEEGFVSQLSSRCSAVKTAKLYISKEVCKNTF